MSASKIIQAYARKALTKNQGLGITTIPGAMQSEAKAAEIVALLQRAGIPINQLDDFIRSEADVAKFLNLIKAASKPRVISGSSPEGRAITEKLFGKKGEVVDMSGKKLDPSKPIMGGTQDDTTTGIMTQIDDRMKNINKANDRLTELLNEREILYGKAPKTKKNEKVVERERFKETNKRFNKTDEVADIIAKITSMEPVNALKEANNIIGRKGIYKNLTKEQSQKILKDTDDWIFQRDSSDLYDYKKNRPFRDDPNFDPDDPDFDPEQGYYTGGMVDVEPSLSDIGHGSDALMARTRLMSPGAQATTSTGLNYLLAEDNDNIRVPFAGGGDAGRRAFLKLLATLTGGAAAFKTGILGFGGKETGKQVAKEVVKSAGSGTPPPYFFKLVEKIKTLGDDVTPSYAVKDRQKVTKYKDYELTEDVVTGEKTIQRMKIDDDLKYDASEYYGKPVGEETYMSYRPGKGQMDETTKGKTPPDEYTEDTSLIRSDKPAEGEVMDTFDGVPDDILEEVGETIVKKADGGRIGFSAGKIVLSKLGINSTSRRFLEKVFGKENFENMIRNDPRMHRGMLEVVEMFRNKDKEGLKMYMQKFMPDMGDAEIEKFIIGDSGTEGIEGQLIRLGSGREYKSLINMKKEADQIRKLDDFDIEGVSKNAEGGRIGFSGGGIYRAIIANSAKKAGMKPYEYIKKTSYKSLPPEVKMFISKTDFEQLKLGQEQMYSNYIDMAKTRLNFQKEIEGGKKTPARELFEDMEKTMDKQSYVPKNVNEKDIGEMELMFKNRFKKGRKDNALGGLQTMLGE